MKLPRTGLWLSCLCSIGLLGCGESQNDAGSDGLGTKQTNPHGLSVTGLQSLSVSLGYGFTGVVCSEPVSYALDVGSKQLAWTRCDWIANGPQLSRGSRTLSDAELRAVTMVMTNHLSTDYTVSCGADKGDESLTLSHADHTATYWDDFYSGCSGEPEKGRAYISGLGDLIVLLAGASQNQTVPTDFASLTFYVAPMPSKDLSAMSGCQSMIEQQAESQYDVDANTHQLSWSLCRSPTPGAAFVTLSGSRILSDAEYASVRTGLATLVLGANGDCTTARPEKQLRTTVSASSQFFTSDVAACVQNPNLYPPPWSPPYIIGLDALIDTVAQLAGRQ
jgi:hypothetical protein